MIRRPRGDRVVTLDPESPTRSGTAATIQHDLVRGWMWWIVDPMVGTGARVTDPDGTLVARTDGGTSRRAHVLAGMLAGMGHLHFVAPGPFDSLVPDELPGRPRAYTHASGLAELLAAGLLANPRTRRRGGLVAAGLFVAVFPGNVNMVRLWWDKGPAMRTLAVARLPLQIPMVLAAMRVAREG